MILEQTMKNKSFIRPTFYCVLVALPLTAVISVVQSHHASLVFSHYFNGKTGNCSLAESFEGEALSRLQLENVNSIRAASKVVRKDERFSLWSTPAGEYWMPTASGDALIYDLAEQKRDIYGRRVHSGDIVLDAGANVGVFTRKALWAGASKIIAIEPGPENLECVRRNFAAEIADGRVVLYPKGIWDKDDVLRLSVDPVSSARDSFVRPIENAQFIEVPLTTVDRLVAELQLPRVDFIKMDIEGAEQRAVNGARNTIAKFRPRMALCIYHVKGDEIMVPKLVAAARPDYKVSKTCFCAADRVQPEVAFFY
jgi:FkbM family methyltransferase